MRRILERFRFPAERERQRPRRRLDAEGGTIACPPPQPAGDRVVLLLVPPVAEAENYIPCRSGVELLDRDVRVWTATGTYTDCLRPRLDGYCGVVALTGHHVGGNRQEA